MKRFFILMLSALVFSACSSLRVSHDYDTEFDFIKQKTFAIAHNNREGEDTLHNDRVQKALEVDLVSKGYTKTIKKDANLVFVFHTSVENKTDIETDYQMIGYRRFGYGGAMIATTNTYHYTKGTLIVDALNPNDEKIVWRGIATDTLNEKKTPEERTEYVNKVVNAMMKVFPSKIVAK